MKLWQNVSSIFLVIALVSQLCFQLATSTPLSPIDFDAAILSNFSCPIWTLTNGNSSCECGDRIFNTVLCDQTTLDIHVLLWHCITYSELLKDTVVGHCLYNLHSQGIPPYGNYAEFPGRVEVNSTIMCQFVDYCEHDYYTSCTYYQYQTGLMCTRCVEGYAYPIYSYSIACVKCTDYKYNWLKYIAVAFLPLTVFYIIVVLFRINVTSGAMNGYVLMCQLVATPFNIKLATKSDFGKTFRTNLYGQAKILFFSFLGIWNLDFFRGVYPTFCLHPKLTTLQTLMLDYVIAVYPLLLIFLSYFFVKLHNRYGIVARLWSPFYKCFTLFCNNFDINRSLVGAFATFLLLSYVKILNVSFYVLTPNTLYNVGGRQLQKRFLYYDGKYEYLRAEHIPYAVLAVFMMLVFNILPLVLLCLYPCRCFHRCLNYCRLQSLTLHIFMDTFNGCFKFQPRDCRYFAALYLFLRLLNHVMIVKTVGPSYIPLAGFLFTIMSAVVAIIRPHRSPWHTLADVTFFVSLSVLFIGLSGYRLIENYDYNYGYFFLYSFGIPVALLQFLYGMAFFIYFLLPKKVLLKTKSLFQYCKLIIRRQTSTAETEDPLPYRFDHSDEYPPLLPPAETD